MQNNQTSQPHNISNFWFGFALGVSAGAAGIYLLGTKNGRKRLERILELTDNLEETVERVLGGIGDEYVADLEGTAPATPRTVTPSQQQKKKSFLRSLFGAIISNFPESKREVKRFKLKDGKIIN